MHHLVWSSRSHDARAGKFSVLFVDRMNRFSRSEDLSDPILVLHAIMAQNAAHSGRPRGRDYGTLLHGGLCCCGYCGRRLDSVGVGRRLPDGTKIIRYCCWMQMNHGKAVCKGVNMRASTLDWAVQLTLDERLRSGVFLDRLFAAWEADEATAQGSVRIAQAALQVQLDQVSALVPGLERRVAKGQAKVTVWRAADRQPRAELVIGLPTNTLTLPPAPEITIAEDGWHVPPALEQGALIAAETDAYSNRIACSIWLLDLDNLNFTDQSRFTTLGG